MYCYTPSMKEKMESDIYEDYKKRKGWAREVAKRMKVRLSDGEEFFEVPIYNEKGEETRVEHIPTGMDVPITDGRGHAIRPPVSPEKVIEAIQRYPDESLSEAVELLEEDEKKQKKSA